MEQSTAGPPGAKPSGWAVGGLIFGGTMLLVIGAFQVVAGLVAIIDDNFYVVAQNYTFDIDTSGWGWIHLILGILLVAVGAGVLGAKTWARATAVFLLALSLIANFFFIPYYPVWAIVVIALDVFVMWSITRPEFDEVT